MMAPGSRAGVLQRPAQRPMSVEEIVKKAQDSSFDSQFSMRNWFRTAEVMLRQANIYEHEGNDEMAYLFLYRHANLILSSLPKHPNADEPQFREAWVQARKTLKRSLAKLEELKPTINRRHSQYEARQLAIARQKEAAQKQDLSQRTEARQTTGNSYQNATYGKQPGSSGNDVSWMNSVSPERLDPAANSDAAVQLANREITRRRTQREVRPRTAQDTATRMTDARRMVEASERNQSYKDEALPHSHHSSFQYPQVPEKGGRVSAEPFPQRLPPQIRTPSTGGPAPPQKLPLLPSKEPISPTQPPELHHPVPHPPPVPAKTFAELSLTPPPSRSASSTPPTKSAHQFATASRLENGDPLRTIYLPAPLRHDFTRIAKGNTLRNLETCGILCGTLLQNALFITKLVIPDQESTSDTCEMINEAALYEYCDSQPEELMVLGWIHTHPTQTCFMSSRDLHTHCWYQVQLPESIAIVCAPSKSPDWGIFRLTDPPGMQAIRTCKQSGIFHPHAEQHIYTDPLGRPGHVIEHEDLQYEVVDLRPSA